MIPQLPCTLNTLSFFNIALRSLGKCYKEIGIFSQHYPSGRVFQFKSRAGSLFGLLPLLLTGSLSYVPLPKGGIPVRRGNSFETLRCRRVQLFPHCAVWKSGSASLVMNPNELLKMPECVPAQAFSFPSPTASLS